MNSRPELEARATEGAAHRLGYSGLCLPFCTQSRTTHSGVAPPTGQFNQVNLPVQSPSDNFGLYGINN